jgi:hypothetical protein
MSVIVSIYIFDNGGCDNGWTSPLRSEVHTFIISYSIFIVSPVLFLRFCDSVEGNKQLYAVFTVRNGCIHH